VDCSLLYPPNSADVAILKFHVHGMDLIIRKFDLRYSHGGHGLWGTGRKRQRGVEEPVGEKQ
jgi:hypothetical protein